MKKTEEEFEIDFIVTLKCPICGNDDVEEWHEYCFNCGKQVNKEFKKVKTPV